MPEIILATLNARYWHAAFGLRYLLANMGPLQNKTEILEFGINDDSIEMLSRILADKPRIVGLGVYIWNVEPLTRLVAELKRVRPETIVVLGGPEVSYEAEGQAIVELADHVISGEADLAFPKLCTELLSGTGQQEKFIAPAVPPLDQIKLPYDLYTDEDIAQRVIYVEASRGCPFTCEFCLSALEIPVRTFAVEDFLAAMQQLLDRGVRQFKFVDRTFNLNLRFSQAILQFFLDQYDPAMFLHFEMIPDRLPDSLRELIQQFPPGALQFEIGVQTFNDDVGELISRRQNNDKLVKNFHFLREETGVHVHADLIVGLPGESVESFAAGFDRLVALDPQEIQVGLLKRLRGTPIVRHDEPYEMVYSPHAPYEILSTGLIDFEEIHQLRRFSRYWDLVSNSGNFVQTRKLLWSDGQSPYQVFRQLSEWLFATENRAHGISLQRLAELMFQFLTAELGHPEDIVAEKIWADYTRGGRSDRPAFLRRFDLPSVGKKRGRSSALPSRQSRHVQV
ncbi:coproporphyrinogen III oxidase [Symmachiella macrocystis]|uniref:Coproporphyrinogen III oxidase n=1 Tax=Symmachiella macrocystis TaxID=2527985 RepID=A0A5C6B1C5_9PLAN|nr:B12-binding domain-containing radical SAM protein [Symmachiella macrocystis]TWU05269.1 coproporphyrinogen III oxidase [Symmachiella macrocystis]